MRIAAVSPGMSRASQRHLASWLNAGVRPPAEAAFPLSMTVGPFHLAVIHAPRDTMRLQRRLMALPSDTGTQLASAMNSVFHLQEHRSRATLPTARHSRRTHQKAAVATNDWSKSAGRVSMRRRGRRW